MILTKTQKLIIEDRGRNLLVSAGAGTGKTRVLVERFISLVAGGEALVTEILALTFTEKAATEMKSRILDRFRELGLDAPRRDLESAYISTFHSFASRLLKEHPLEAAVDPDFHVIEQDDADQLKARALEEAIEKMLEENRAEVFSLLKTYGDENLRLGIEKIYRCAKVEGKSVAQFLAEKSNAESSQNLSLTLQAENRLEELGEKDLARELKAFASRPDWDWGTVEEWKEWSSSFSRRGGKKEKPLWKELSGLCEQVLEERLEVFAQPWKEKIEKLALSFETIYQRLKQEESCLDFDDLQIKVLELFEKEKPANRKLRLRYQKQFRFMMIDEFQDTSPIQARLVDLLSSGNNLFYVGDFKQSIYGFRGTSPVHFLKKEKEYTDPQKGTRISLLENFRTRDSVLQFINQFFEHLWKEDNLPFEGLLARAQLPELPVIQDESACHPVTILRVPLKDDEPVSRGRIREARAIADQIRAHHEAGVSYGEMAILFQAMSASAIYEQALKKQGIPFFVISGRGFYHQLEIKDMMNFLAFLDNPLADIPLAALLRSPMFQMTDDSLAWIAEEAKRGKETEPLYQGVRNYQNISALLPDQKEKLERFWKISSQLLQEKDTLYLSELLEKILAATDYDVLSLADEQGIRRYANLKKLIDLAREKEARERFSLGDFIRFIRHLENQEVRESEAQIEAEKSGKVVRLMTIHAAKGLEFPVVFVADLAYESRSSESKTFLAESGCGYAVQIFNEKMGEKENPRSWVKIDDAIRLREKEEWKRLFYVALTRAKSKLFLTGVVKPGKTLKPSFRQMACWMDWLTASEEQLTGLCHIQDVSQDFRPLPARKFPMEKKTVFAATQSDLFETDVTQPLSSEASHILDRLKPFSIRPSRVINLPVSAYSSYQKNKLEYRKIYELGLAEPEKREILLETDREELSASQFGTLMHRVLERLDFKSSPKKPDQMIEEVFRGADPAEIEEAKALLKLFVQSPIFSELRSARRVFREIPFVIDERHGRVHGVIDLLYQDAKGQFSILDYKTAQGSLEKVQASGYEVQLKLYALAAYQILGQAPKQSVLYFLKNQWTHILPFESGDMETFRTQFQEMQESLLQT